MGVLITPLCLGASIYRDWSALYGWTMCQLAGMVVAALCAISIYSITFLTVDKFVYIKYPMRYLRLFTIRRVKTSIALMWLALFTFFVVHKLTWSKYYYDRKAYVCSIDFPKQWRFTLFVIATIVVPPAIIIVYCNYVTFKVTPSVTCTIMHLFMHVYAIRATYYSF